MDDEETRNRPLSSSTNGLEESGVPSSFLAEVACAVLDQHHQFTETQLLQYVSDYYPEVPPGERRALIIGAVTGAQKAAKLQFLIEKNKASNDIAKREIAANAGSSLSFWNMGLHQMNRSELAFRRPHMVEDTATVSVSRASASNETKTVTKPQAPFTDLQFPVSLTQSNEQFNSATAFDVMLELETDDVTRGIAHVPGPMSFVLQEPSGTQLLPVPTETNDPLQDALQASGIITQQLMETTASTSAAIDEYHVITSFTETNERRMATVIETETSEPTQDISDFTDSRKTGESHAAMDAEPLRTTVEFFPDERSSVSLMQSIIRDDSLQSASNQLQGQSSSATCPRITSVDTSEMDKDQADRASSSSGHNRQPKDTATLSRSSTSGMSSQEILEIDLNAPSDLDITTPSCVKKNPRSTTHQEDGLTKKPSYTSSRNDKLQERRPTSSTVKNQSNVPSSRVERRNDKPRDYPSRSSRPEQPRSRSRSLSPRRSSRKMERSPDRMVLTGRQLELYRRWMRRQNN